MQILGTGLDADFGECFEKSLLFAALRRDDVGAGADEASSGDGILEDIAEIDACVIKILRAVIEILRVDEDTDALLWMFNDCDENESLATRV